MKFLFLYTELAGYFLACVETLVERADSEVHIVRWPVNKEAPFQFTYSKKITVYERNAYSSKTLLELVQSINPDLIYCSGWIDKGYLNACRKWKGKALLMLGLDNKWKGSVRQRLGAVYFKLNMKSFFSYCWVPGKMQKELAKHIGFDEKNILTGFYSCNYSYFNGLYLENRIEKKNKFPHVFIFVGRYYEFKGIKELWQSFIELQNESPNDWELWCLGTGDVPPVIHPKIKHFGFVQSNDMVDVIRNGGVFILPSTFEPWGVVVHEFASAGFPLICSNEVGATELFLKENENGFLVPAGSIPKLKSAMKKMISLPDERLNLMGEKSVTLASQITPEKWADSLIKIIA